LATPTLTATLSVAERPKGGPERRTKLLIEQLLSDRILERLRRAQNILRLAETYGRARLEAACTRAMTHPTPTYRTVKTILAGGFDRLPLPNACTDGDFVYGRDARFQRDAQTLFTFDIDADDKIRH
jgi:hypothetical protein